MATQPPSGQQREQIPWTSAAHVAGNRFPFGTVASKVSLTVQRNARAPRDSYVHGHAWTNKLSGNRALIKCGQLFARGQEQTNLELGDCTGHKQMCNGLWSHPFRYHNAKQAAHCTCPIQGQRPHCRQRSGGTGQAAKCLVKSMISLFWAVAGEAEPRGRGGDLLAVNFGDDLHQALLDS